MNYGHYICLYQKKVRRADYQYSVFCLTDQIAQHLWFSRNLLKNAGAQRGSFELSVRFVFERGDGGKWRIGYTNLFKKDKRYKNTHLQGVILFEANILYIESFLHYIITTKDKEYKIKESISAFEQK